MNKCLILIYLIVINACAVKYKLLDSRVVATCEGIQQIVNQKNPLDIINISIDGIKYKRILLAYKSRRTNDPSDFDSLEYFALQLSLNRNGKIDWHKSQLDNITLHKNIMEPASSSPVVNCSMNVKHESSIRDELEVNVSHLWPNRIFRMDSFIQIQKVLSSYDKNDLEVLEFSQSKDELFKIWKTVVDSTRLLLPESYVLYRLKDQATSDIFTKIFIDRNRYFDKNILSTGLSINDVLKGNKYFVKHDDPKGYDVLYICFDVKLAECFSVRKSTSNDKIDLSELKFHLMNIINTTNSRVFELVDSKEVFTARIGDKPTILQLSNITSGKSKDFDLSTMLILSLGFDIPIVQPTNADGIILYGTNDYDFNRRLQKHRTKQPEEFELGSMSTDEQVNTSH